jgi:hypothetical protein
MVIVEEATGVAPEVVSVIVVEHVGLQEVGLKEAEAPVGNPEAEKDTAVVVPEDSVAVIVLVAGDP